MPTQTAGPTDQPARVLDFWWTVELFSPQRVPPVKESTRATPIADVERHGPLPWLTLQPPAPRGKTEMSWQHLVYLGIYDISAIYEHLHQVFHDDRDAYDERPPGSSSCAFLVLDQDGRYVADSAVLSSAVWGVGRVRRRGRRGPRFDGFEQAQQLFVDQIAKGEVSRAEQAGSDHPPPYTFDDLVETRRLTHRLAEVVGLDGMDSGRMRVRSRQVRADRAGETDDADFLNSFFLHDIDQVRRQLRLGEVGPALRAYLSSQDAVEAASRTDVVRDQAAVVNRTGVWSMPLGRWPAEAAHPLALSQQFAVNQAFTELSGSGGLLGVNGPPGTGKTTMLRELVAGNVVERARRLADLAKPGDAFVGEPHRWRGRRGPQAVPRLRPELTGFEMVVASLLTG